MANMIQGSRMPSANSGSSRGAGTDSIRPIYPLASKWGGLVPTFGALVTPICEIRFRLETLELSHTTHVKLSRFNC
jgi:hypothetical protein